VDAHATTAARVKKVTVQSHIQNTSYFVGVPYPLKEISKTTLEIQAFHIRFLKFCLALSNYKKCGLHPDRIFSDETPFKTHVPQTAAGTYSKRNTGTDLHSRTAPVLIRCGIGIS
jgi:hypothetical protein